MRDQNYMSLLVSIICFLQTGKNHSLCNYFAEVNCGHPGQLYNGWLEGIEGGTMLGASIIFRCREGMVLEGNSSTVCQMDGSWRYPLPKCLGKFNLKKRVKRLFNMYFRSLRYPQCSQGPGGEKHNSGSCSATWVPP